VAHPLPQLCWPQAGTGRAWNALNALQQRLARHKGVDQVGAVLGQRRAHRRQRRPGPPRLFREEHPPSPLAFHVAGQRLKHLAEGQVGIPGTSMGVAPPAQGDQVAMGRTGPPGELVKQSRLAAARLAGDQSHASLAGQGLLEDRAQAGQFLLPGDKAKGRLGTGGDGARGRSLGFARDRRGDAERG
jgi:hypothetical protein